MIMMTPTCIGQQMMSQKMMDTMMLMIMKVAGVVMVDGTEDERDDDVVGRDAVNPDHGKAMEVGILITITIVVGITAEEEAEEDGAKMVQITIIAVAITIAKEVAGGIKSQ